MDVSAYTINKPHEAAWLVYINGLEIPTLGVDVSFGVWQIPTAAIKLAPHPMLQRLGSEDRLHVVIFYKDEFTPDESSQFRLLGEFEIVGWTYQNSPTGRVLQLDCVNPVQIFTQLHCFYMSSMDDIVAASAQSTDPTVMSQPKVFYPASLFMEGLVKTGESARSDEYTTAQETLEAKRAELNEIPVIEEEYSSRWGEWDDDQLKARRAELTPGAKETVAINAALQIRALDSEIKGLAAVQDNVVGQSKFIKRPIEFVLNVLRAILLPVDSGEDPTVSTKENHIPRDAVAVPGKNFFARWMLRTRFHTHWCALPMFEDPTPVPARAGRAPSEPEPEQENSGNLCFPLVKAVQDYHVIQALQTQIGSSVGNSGSIWDLLRQVYAFMYMEIAMIPCPPSGVTTKRLGHIVGGGPSDTVSRGTRAYFVKPQCVFGLPPMCNVIFPSMTQHFTFQETYITQPTRLYLGESFLSEVIDPSNSLGQLPAQLLTTGFPPVVKHRMQESWQSRTVNSKNFLSEPEELYKGPVSKRVNAPPWMYMLQQNASSLPPEQAALVGLTDAQINEMLLSGEGAAPPPNTGLGALFDKYAEYEYYRSRFAERQGGVALAFQPYLLPGFPAAVYDQQASGFDVMAYVMAVSHSMSADKSGAHMSTQATLGFIRTFEEMAEGRALSKDLKHEAASYESDLYPPEPIPGVRDIFQKKESAEEFYRVLLHGPDSKDKRFKAWRSGELTEKDEQEEAGHSRVPKPSWAAAFESYDAAMRAISRPVCTLREYVENYHQRPIDELLADGIVKGEYHSHYSAVGDTDSKGAVFWARIYTNKSAPAGYTAPDKIVYVQRTETPTATGEPSVLYSAPEEWQIAGPEDLPDVRKNWDKILNEYRKILRSEEGKVAPQQ